MTDTNGAIALQTIADWPITDPANMDAVNMAKVARDALASPPSPAEGDEPMSPNEIYAEGRADQWEQDYKDVRLLLDNCDDEDSMGDGRINTTRVRELLSGFLDAKSSQEQPPALSQRQAQEPAGWREALQFYADGNHFVRHDAHAWDTVSGEPTNFQEDEANTATVEDGTVAAMALAGTPLRDDEPPAQEQAAPAVPVRRILHADEPFGEQSYTPIPAPAEASQDYEQVLADHRHLVRELDVLLNGEGAAQQASLCDIVAHMRAEGFAPNGFGACRVGDVGAFPVVRLSDAAAELSRLRAEVERLRADAERYRALRSLKPREFHDLWMRALHGETSIDLILAGDADVKG